MTLVNGKTLYRAADIAEKLNVHQSSVYVAAKELGIGVITGVPSKTNPTLFTEDDVELMRLRFNENGVAPAASPLNNGTANRAEFAVAVRKVLHLMRVLGIATMTLQDGKAEFDRTITETIEG